jgi:hypothetical protein
MDRPMAVSDSGNSPSDRNRSAINMRQNSLCLSSILSSSPLGARFRLKEPTESVSLTEFFLQDAPTFFGLIELHGQILNLVVQPHRFLRIDGG